MNATTPSASTPLSRGSMKVLVVDDDDFQIDLMTELLRELGVTDVASAANGRDALAHLKGRAAGLHLILLDLHMPGTDGFEFMESAEELGFSGGLIIVSGQNDDVMRAASLVARLRRFRLLGSIPKPVDRQQLSALLAQLAS